MSPTMWWPSLEALNDLTIEDEEHGFTLFAPEETECGAWLSYWSQDDEHEQIFSNAFIQLLRDQLNYLETKNGKTEAVDDEQSADRAQTENDLAGSQS